MKLSIRKTDQIDLRLLLCVFGVTTALAAVLRTVQLFTNIEPHTGFFAAVDWSVYVLYGLLLLSVLLLTVLPACSARIPASRAIVRKDPALVAASGLFAVGLLYDAALAAMQIPALVAQNNSLPVGTLLFSEGLLAEALRAVCGVLAAVYMLLLAVSYAKGTKQFAKFRLLALTPLFWAMFRIVLRFMTKISFTMVSELLLELAMLAFMMLFLLSFARIAAEVNPKGEMRKAVRFGLPAAFLAAVIGLSRLVCTVAGKGELLADGFAFSFGEIGFAVFAVVFLAQQLRFGRPASEEPAMAQAQPEDAAQPNA